MTKYNVFIENSYIDFEIDEVSIYNNVVKITDYFFKIADVIKLSCLKDFKYESISFDIVLVNNEEIQRINKEYRKKDASTDVITFAIFADSPQNEKFIIDNDINLGEIIISLDKIVTQSQENNITFKEELYYIISHGILHLLGFDHQNENDYNFMTKYQNKAKAFVL